MQYQSTAASTSQGQLDGELSRLYQHFLTGDISSLEFSELVDELICMDALINESLEEEQEVQLCQAA